MREAKPWYRKSNDSWYVEISGQQVRLAKGKANRAQAIKQFHLLMSGTRPVTPKSLTAAEVCDLFLCHSEKEHKEETFKWHQRYLQNFSDRCGHLKTVDLIPFHLTSWFDAQGWKATRRHATGIVKRAFAWCREQGLIDKDPFVEVSVPKGGRRERILTEFERKEILSAIRDREFREFVFAMQSTGCRPGEVRSVTAAEINFEVGLWVITKHKTANQTGKPRVVYLTPTMVELCRGLAEKYPEGPIFRSNRKKPFSRNAVRIRFRRLRAKLPHLKGVVAYTFRHTYWFV